MAFHQPPSGLGDEERALQVDGKDAFDVILGQVLKQGIALVAGVVDDYIDPAEALQRAGGDRFATRFCCHVIAIGDSPAARLANFRRDLFGKRYGGTLAPRVAAKVVDHNRRAAFGQQLGIGLAQPAGGAGDDGDPAGQVDIGYHVASPGIATRAERLSAIGRHVSSVK